MKGAKDPLHLKIRSRTSRFFNEYGHVPLPPYIKRADEELDKSRYATVYENKLQDSVVAPTAGLHFTSDLLDIIKNAGVEILKVNLSVGAGTFSLLKLRILKIIRSIVNMLMFQIVL